MPLNFNIDYPAWFERAACWTTPNVDPAWFHGQKGSRMIKAKDLCNGNRNKRIPPCPVKQQCLEWILAFDKKQGCTTPGMYGGVGFKARSNMRTCKNPDCNKKPPTNKYYCSKECNDNHPPIRNIREDKYG